MTRRWLDDPPEGISGAEWDDVLDAHPLVTHPTYIECACGWHEKIWRTEFQPVENMASRLGRQHRRRVALGDAP